MNICRTVSDTSQREKGQNHVTDSGMRISKISVTETSLMNITNSKMLNNNEGEKHYNHIFTITDDLRRRKDDDSGDINTRNKYV